MKGTSNAPLILGIIGSILCIPGMLCFSCVGAITSAGGASGAGTVVLIFGLFPVISGIVGGVYGKSNPIMSMIILLASAFITGIVWFMTAFSSLFHLAALILFAIGAIMAKVQEMETPKS